MNNQIRQILARLDACTSKHEAEPHIQDLEDAVRAYWPPPSGEPVEDGYGFDALIEAFTIFRRYGNPQWPTCCGHDEMRVCINPKDVGKPDLERLEALGFSPGEYDFVSYRFGNA